jgi:hypothetical protein
LSSAVGMRQFSAPRACLSERSRSTKGSARTACNSTSFRCSSFAASSSSLSCSRASEIRTTALATSPSAIGWAGGTASGTRKLRQSQGLLSREVTGCATLQLGSSTLQALRAEPAHERREQLPRRALAVVERGRHHRHVIGQSPPSAREDLRRTPRSSSGSQYPRGRRRQTHPDLSQPEAAPCPRLVPGSVTSQLSNLTGFESKALWSCVLGVVCFKPFEGRTGGAGLPARRCSLRRTRPRPW